MLKHFLIVIRNTLSCLNLLSSVHLDRAHKYWGPPHPLPPLPFFPHWQLKLELATFFSVSHFLCALRHVWAPHLDTHMRRETHAGADVTVCVHAGARTGNAVRLPELITLNTKKPFPPCDLSKMEVLKGFPSPSCLAGPMIHRGFPCCSHDRIVRRQHNNMSLEWITSTLVHLIEKKAIFRHQAWKKCNSVATKSI